MSFINFLFQELCHAGAGSGESEVENFSFDFGSGETEEADFSFDVDSGETEVADFSFDVGSGETEEADFSFDVGSGETEEVDFSFDVDSGETEVADFSFDAGSEEIGEEDFSSGFGPTMTAPFPTLTFKGSAPTDCGPYCRTDLQGKFIYPRYCGNKFKSTCSLQVLKLFDVYCTNLTYLFQV